MTYYLAEYQTFDTVQEMDHHIDLYRPHVSRTSFKVLWLISNYACRYPGAAHLKAQTIADQLGVSTKTVYRSLDALVEAGAIVKHVQYRPVKGGQGATIYTVQPFESNRIDADKPCESKSESVKSENQSAFSINLPENHFIDTVNADEIKKDSDNSSENEVPATALKNAIPESIYSAITRYFSGASDVYKYYGILLRAKASVSKNTLFEHTPEVFVEAWNKCILAWKTRRVKKSFEALLFSSIQAATIESIRLSESDSYVAKYASWLD